MFYGEPLLMYIVPLLRGWYYSQQPIGSRGEDARPAALIASRFDHSLRKTQRTLSDPLLTLLGLPAFGGGEYIHPAEVGERSFNGVIYLDSKQQAYTKRPSNPGGSSGFLIENILWKTSLIWFFKPVGRFSSKTICKRYLNLKIFVTNGLVI